MEPIRIEALDFAKGDGLLPAIVQDAATFQVLMLGYVNEEALRKTIAEKRVTFYSRSKGRLWTKGETSGHYLDLVEVKQDCDRDTLLFRVRPNGPVCHLGADTCFGENNDVADFLPQLERVIHARRKADPESSYTAKLFHKGINKIAQKVGEEAVELIIEAKDDDASLFLNEAADLLYHYLVLLTAKGHTLGEVSEILRARHR